MTNTPVPMTIIGGFLGAGKTTLLNRILSEPHGVRYAVLVNDFGSISVDDSLVTRHDGETIAFANGCLCCSLGSSLMDSIDRLLEGDNIPEQFLVEASGVANPRAIADLATLHPGLKRDMTVVLADAETVLERADDERLTDTIQMQLASADLILLNKCDLVADRDRVTDWLGASYSARVVECEHADVPLDVLRAVDSHNAVRFSPAQSGSHDPHGTFTMTSATLTRAVDRDRLCATLTGEGLLRAKGFVRLTSDNALHHVEVVGNRIAISPWRDEPVSTLSNTEPGIVLIGIGDGFDALALKQLLEAL